MKKTFVLTHPKIKTDRLFEAVKRDVKKYIKREQKKELPENVDYWDFDCKYGHTAEEAKTIHIAEINKFIDEAEELKLESFYLEIIAKAGHRKTKENIE
jgi:hypothetical protein